MSKFIKVTYHKAGHKDQTHYVDAESIERFYEDKPRTKLYFKGREHPIIVTETPEEILALIAQ